MYLFFFGFRFFFLLGGAGCHVAQDSPKFTVADVDFKVLLPEFLAAKCWNDRHGPADPTSDCSGCTRFFTLKYNYTTPPFPIFLSSPPVFFPSLRLRLWTLFLLLLCVYYINAWIYTANLLNLSSAAVCLLHKLPTPPPTTAVSASLSGVIGKTTCLPRRTADIDFRGRCTNYMEIITNC